MMDNYLIERATLEEFIDSLLKEKYTEGAVPEGLREQKIKELDDRIAVAIFGSLNDEQLDEINKVMDADGNEDEYVWLFERWGVDVEEKMKSVMAEYKKELLGGER